MTGRGLRGRAIARLTLFSVIALDALLALLFLSAPATMGPNWSDPPSVLGLPVGLVLSGFGIAVNLVGLAWMVRIVRADPEGHRSWWRFARS